MHYMRSKSAQTRSASSKQSHENEHGIIELMNDMAYLMTSVHDNGEPPVATPKKASLLELTNE